MAVRDKETGKFVSEEDKQKNKKTAIFASVGKGTCGFRNLTLTMEAGEINREKGKSNVKGKRIEFGPNGQYETTNAEEIKFLEWKEDHPQPFSKIKCIQEVGK